MSKVVASGSLLSAIHVLAW